MTPETMSAAERDAKRKSKWDTAQEVSDNFIKLEKPGDFVEGVLREVTEVKFRPKVVGGEPTIVNRYTLERQTADNKSEMVAVLGTVGLDDKMRRILLNTEVFIRFDGVGKNNFRLYTVKYI